ncbi:NudC domain-containing protein 3 [Eumeta japonica]|uniref:NudC domain-containing protein 3 n=1 Tax=Eumeta variegata TaxID=151549 RepID=A0A4C1VIK1_EUMVA|nr:NudC domain-containing protein 3 [Eumeta japonica]
MSDTKSTVHYDEVLLSILVNEKSIIGFLSTVFNFLARRTDFYYVPQNPNENFGFPPGVAEELVVKILRKCDPKNWDNAVPPKSSDISNDVMCSTVAQEIEIEANEETPDLDVTTDENIEQKNNIPQTNISKVQSPKSNLKKNLIPQIPVQNNSESYNGAIREKYSWSQTITDLDVSVTLPLDIMSAKDVSVSINPEYINIRNKNDGSTILKDNFRHKVKTLESFWTVTGGSLQIHLVSEDGLDDDEDSVADPDLELPCDDETFENVEGLDIDSIIEGLEHDDNISPDPPTTASSFQSISSLQPGQSANPCRTQAKILCMLEEEKLRTE